MSIKKGKIYIHNNQDYFNLKNNSNNIVLALEDEACITWDDKSRYSSADDLVAILENEKVSYAWVHDLKLIGI